ncbi:hypothetical protein [Pinirhizobacter soli]|uniref:hypothetical protein n=1 Tax=Pinirhizobacter soli TaxID=2786953 RepID=UPI00202A5FE5|nr:hypothetical protein [Pinirhizobacter soli]
MLETMEYATYDPNPISHFSKFDVLKDALVCALDVLVHRLAAAKIGQEVIDIVNVGRLKTRQMKMDERRVGIGLIQQVEGVV